MRVLPLGEENKGGEAESQQAEEDRPAESAAKARTRRPAAEHDKIDGQQQQNDGVEADPIGEGRAGDHAAVSEHSAVGCFPERPRRRW